MRLLAALLLGLLLAAGYAQEPFKPTERDKQQIQAKLKVLTAAVNSLRAAKADDDLLVDAEVCQRAVENILRFPEEFYDQQHVINALTTLDRGLDRAQQLKEGKHGWTQQKGLVTRAYRSRVDGTPQPYRVVVPDSYDGSKPMRLYVRLHGKGETDFEVNWLGTAERPNLPDHPVDYIQLFAFGRSNNGFHWAGETDVFEAIASVRKRYNIDADRIVLRGFSMGGVGAWHIGLHHPSEFAALEAGGGNTNSRRHAILARIPPVAQATMRIYEDMAASALNIFNLPTAGYGGEMDPELEASLRVREQLEREGFPFNRQRDSWKARDLQALFLVGPKTGHTMPPADTRAQIEAFLTEAANRGRVTPDHIRFVTYTPRYGRSYWVSVGGLQQQYQRAEVDARREDGSYTVKTKNISRLLLTDLQQPRRISIDGDTFPLRPGPPAVFLENSTGHWRPARPEPDLLRKRHGLQGPIDDAFMDSFLCIRPTGTPLNAIADEYGRKEFERFANIFAKYFRGDVRLRDDSAIAPADIANNNIILFGDPGSNRIMTRLIGRLPIKWTKDSIVAGDRTYSAADHVPVLIYPNPLNPRRYVVINSGHTADIRDYKGDYQLPRFGDYAVFKVTKAASGELASEVAETGLFDDAWRLAAR